MFCFLFADNPDLVQVICGYGETGNALVTGGVDKVLFIGSPQVGKLVQKG
jgi:acyl-CoA reductase-like NAD-dependent aldehyde dehydrogenase